MCEWNLVKVQCVTVKLLTIMSNNSNVIEYKMKQKLSKSCYFQNKCCSITSRRAVMCVTVKLSILVVTFRTLQTVP